jgi:NADH-quinone oxidoreductase subunit C
MTTPAELESNLIVGKLTAFDPPSIVGVERFRGELTVEVQSGAIRRVAEFLCRDEDLQFRYLADVTAVDRYPVEPRFEVNYHLYSLRLEHWLRIKARLSGENPTIESVTSIWPGANWHERETFDLFGIRFAGHPDLRRILMPEHWQGHPLRRDYPTEGYR